MRRLLVFLGVAGGILGIVALANWWVDPFGQFYRGTSALRAAARADPPCLISNDLIGGSSYLRFKEDVFRLRQARTVVLGSSRVLKIGSNPGERSFANLGVPQVSLDQILGLVRTLARETPRTRPLTLYLGVEFFWFNPEFKPFTFGSSVSGRLRYLLSWSTLKETAKLLRRGRTLALERGRRRFEIHGTCVLGRESPALAWRPDGTRVYSFELDPHGYRPPKLPFTTDIDTLRAGVYAGFHGFDSKLLGVLDDLLDLASRRGWRVVGFAPPDATRYARLFASSPRTRVAWEAFGNTVPQAFARHGYPFLDLRDVRSVPCAQDDFVDDGFHTDARCSARLRRLLDAAATARPAAVALGDSVTAGNLAPPSWTQLVGRRLGRPVLNDGVDGATTGGLLARSRVALATDAPAVVVFGGGNDAKLGIPPARTLANLSRLFARVRQVGRTPVLVGPLPRADVSPERLAALRAAVRRLAARAGVRFVDPWPALVDPRRPGRLAPGLTADGVHPNERGTQLIARAIAPALER